MVKYSMATRREGRPFEAFGLVGPRCASNEVEH